MIKIYPELNAGFRCPSCGQENLKAVELLFGGVHCAADCKCPNCSYVFVHDLPVGHALAYPVIFGKADKKLHNGPKWLAKSLIEIIPENTNIKIKEIVNKKYESVIILNCLDPIYGHVLLKLLNATNYLDKHSNKGLICVVPDNLAWMVPKEVAEVWILETTLNSYNYFIPAFNVFVQSKIKNYNEVFLSVAYSHPDVEQIDIERFTRVKPFKIDEFLETVPHITFVTREDRPWIRSAAGMLLFQSLKLKIDKKLASSLFVPCQSRRIVNTARKIRKHFPEAVFSAAGIGKSGSFPSWIKDLRTAAPPDSQMEVEWCKLYAKSHIVIGIHGSNMLLPTAHAAAFINILPDDRLGNIMQDVISPNTGRMSVFLGRYLREYASPYEVAKIARSILYFFETFQLNMDKHAKPENEDDIFSMYLDKWKPIKYKIGKNRGLKKLINNYKI